MATKKATASKSTSSRASSTAKKTTASKKTTTSEAAKVSSPKIVQKSVFPANIANIILAELVGTFILTIVAITAFAVSPFAASMSGVLGAWLVDPLFIGLTLMLLVMGIGAVSGAHVNPAVTFGFWSMRRIKTVMVPVYWASQFLGVLLAIGVASIITNGQFAVNAASFSQLNWSLLFVELIGTAVFMFGIAGVASREDLKSGAKAVGVGMALTIGLIAGISLLTVAQKADYKKYSDDATAAQSAQTDAANAATPTLSRTLSVDGPVLNPAVALAIHEDSSIANRITQSTSTDKKEPTRFGLETILGGLIGAALGGNLFLLVAYRQKNES